VLRQNIRAEEISELVQQMALRAAFMPALAKQVR
jgi:hypothetical protein